MGYFSKYVESYGEGLYVLFRVLVGLMFFLHGWDKLFTNGVQIASMMGVAGVIELLAGAAVFLGFFVRLGALAGAITMVVAYFTVHFGGGWSPLANGGELAVMYFGAFLVLLAFGARRWSLEKKLLRKETF